MNSKSYEQHAKSILSACFCLCSLLFALFTRLTVRDQGAIMDRRRTLPVGLCLRISASTFIVTRACVVNSFSFLWSRHFSRTGNVFSVLALAAACLYKTSLHVSGTCCR